MSYKLNVSYIRQSLVFTMKNQEWLGWSLNPEPSSYEAAELFI